MRKMSFTAIFLALIIAGPAVRAQTSVLVYDPLQTTSEKNFTDADESFVKAKILPKIKNIWSRESGFDGSGLSVIGAVDGAFTRKAAKQRAVVYEMCQTGSGFANNGLVVVENSRIAAHFVTNGGWNIDVSKIGDINKNGLDEIAIQTSGGMHQGYTGSSLSIIEVSPASVRSLGTFLAYTNECESGPAGEFCDRSYKITARKGPSPIFSRQKYENKGDDEKPKWAAAGKTQRAKPIAGVSFKYILVK